MKNKLETLERMRQVRRRNPVCMLDYLLRFSCCFFLHRSLLFVQSVLS